MRLGKLSLAACMLTGSGIAAAAVEMTKPFEALEQSRRFMIELNKRQEREGVERQAQEKEKEAKRKSEEAEQRKRERAEKAQQQAEQKRDSTAAKAAEGASPSSPSLQPQPSTPMLPDQPNAQVPMTLSQASREAAESQPLAQNAPAARPQVGTPPPTAQPPKSPAPSRPEEHSPQTRPERGESLLGVKQGEVEPKGRLQSANAPAVGVSGVPDGAAGAAPAAGEYVAVSRVKRMNLYNDRGDKLGDVERVLQSSDGTFHIVIGTGGLLGLRERAVRIPLERVTVRRDRLVIEGLADDQLRMMPVFDRNDRTYRDLARNITVPLVRDRSDK